MITRVWRGWTTPENAEAYRSLLQNEIVPHIESRKLAGYHGMSVGRRNLESEVEFITIMWFDSMDDVKSFAGADFDKAVVPENARKLLTRFDECSAHYETLVPPPR